MSAISKEAALPRTNALPQLADAPRAAAAVTEQTTIEVATAPAS
jgi:hypothetical protein